MKKFIYKIFALVVSLIVCCPQSFAVGHIMSERNHSFFINRLREVMGTFIKKNETHLRHKSDEEISNFLDSFSDSNKMFDITHGIADDIPVSFEDAMNMYYTHVSKPDDFAGRPLCSRGLAMYVLKELLNQKVDCRYIKLTFNDCQGCAVLNDAIAYKTPKGWYVCDLNFALARIQ